jgi:hypothetical protein
MSGMMAAMAVLVSVVAKELSVDPTRFDDVIRSLSTRTARRGILGRLAGGLLATLPLALGRDKTMAKKKKGGKGKKKKKAAAVSPPPVPPATVPPPPARPTKQYKQLCTVGVDTCASPYQCNKPTAQHQCDSTVAETNPDRNDWCCVPPNGACTIGACDCCGDYYCGGNSTCELL